MEEYEDEVSDVATKGGANLNEDESEDEQRVINFDSRLR